MKEKLCECGCGQPAPIATKTYKKFGHTKGEPMRYLLGHCRKRWPEKKMSDRFWEKVDKTSTCWLWTAARDQNGYGRFRIRDNDKLKTRLAHHVSYRLLVGAIPDGNELLHECDNPACVRPHRLHVRPGTHLENMRGCVERNRIATGDRHGMVKKMLRTKQSGLNP